MVEAVVGQPICRICSSALVDTFQAKEMMFGLRERFNYFECKSCNCVQIAEYPENVTRFYPINYYAYEAPKTKRIPNMLARIKTGVRNIVVGHSTTRAIWLQGPAIRDWIAKDPIVKFYLDRFPDVSTNILDVGCGTGSLLRDLRYWGFKNAEGVDPYIEKDVAYQGKMLVWKRSLSGMTPSYDCISFHHSLEHMPDQAKVLTEARRLLAPGGIIIIRIPVAGGAAWRTYRENWVQLDPPRHFYLHSEASLRLLAEQAGLMVDTINYDSTGFQIWGSELYLKNIPLMDEVSRQGQPCGVLQRSA